MQENNVQFYLGVSAVIGALIVIGGITFFVSDSKNLLNLGNGVDISTLVGTDVTSIAVAETVTSDFKDTETYTHASGFSFNYPKSYTVGEFEEGDGHMVLLQDPSKNIGLQISVRPFDEDITALTEARIRQDLPDIAMEGVVAVNIAGVEGLAFKSRGDTFGESVEVWFVSSGKLYQISTYASQAALLERVINSFQF